MSAKNTKKKSGKRVVLWTILIIEVIVLAAALLVWWAFAYDSNSDTPVVPTEPAATEAVSSEPVETVPQMTVPAPTIEEIQDVEPVSTDTGLTIRNIGAYTGAFVEDGTNEIVSGVLMLVVDNNSEEAVQYAEITLPTEAGDAKFSLSTLPAGEAVVLLEQNRMQYTGNEDAATAVSSSVAYFQTPMSLHEDKLEFQILDGAINVTNISGADITDDVVIYYKNAATDLYYGGITYRIRIAGGLKAGEIKQMIASHFSDSGSKIMFVTVG